MHPNRRRRRRTTAAPKRKRVRVAAASVAAASLMPLNVLPELLGGGNVMQSAIENVLKTDGDWEFPEFPPPEEETYAGGLRRLIGRMFQT